MFLEHESLDISEAREEELRKNPASALLRDYFEVQEYVSEQGAYSKSAYLSQSPS